MLEGEADMKTETSATTKESSTSNWKGAIDETFNHMITVPKILLQCSYENQ